MKVIIQVYNYTSMQVQVLAYDEVASLVEKLGLVDKVNVNDL